MSDCDRKECTMGSLIVDSYVHRYVARAEPGQWTYAAIAVINVNGIRTAIDAGGKKYSS